MTLDQMLDTMDVPAQRKQWQIRANRHWLFRNLVFRNKQNPHFDEVIKLLKEAKDKGENI